MVGHDAETNRIYGMASDGVSFLASSDNGDSWESCHVDDVTKSKAKPNFTGVKVVPWKDDTNLKLGNPDTSYTAATWGGLLITILHDILGIRNKYIVIYRNIINCSIVSIIVR